MPNDTVTPTREVVGLLATREAFDAAVTDLTAAGFRSSDLSVLSSHDSIDAAGKPGTKWKDALTALVGETKYEVPLVASGAVALFGGPAAAAVAGVIGAAVGATALHELISEVTSTPDTADFTRAVEAGSIILWVRVDTDAQQRQAEEILQQVGATNIHLHRSGQ